MPKPLILTDYFSYCLGTQLTDSDLFSKSYTFSEIELEHEEYKEANTTPLKFDSQIGFPYANLSSSRDFERLLYSIYTQDETKAKLGAFYDTVILMQGTGERGRDLSLTLNGVAVGLVQAKKYSVNLSRKELGCEIIKFALHATLDEKLIPKDSEKFHYCIAVSCGLAEKAGELIADINSNTLDSDELRGWVNSVVSKNLALSKLTYEEIENELNTRLVIIHTTQLIPTDLDAYLASPAYSNIVRIFFRVTPIIDRNAFEEILAYREARKIEFDASLSPLEKRLQLVDEQLFVTLTKIKNYAFECYNEFSHQCLMASNHLRIHHSTLVQILSETVLDEDLIESLNTHELFILSASAFLTDIGICADFETLEKQLQIIKETRVLRGMTNELRAYHHRLTANRILTMEIIPEQYREAIALVAGVGIRDIQNISSHPEELSIEPISRKKACIPLLSYSLLIADMIDINSLTSSHLFAHHKHLDGINEAVAVWEEVPPKLQVVPTHDGKRLQLLGAVSNQLVHLGLLEHLKLVQRLLSSAHESLRKRPDRQLTLVFADHLIKSPFDENFGFSVAEENILSTFIEKSMYTKELMAIRELIQNAIDSCLFRLKQSNLDYSPKIQVQITETTITVSDNGMGMDRHDVKFYFSRLGRSFYKENAVENSIGRFGVGVFAYFMISDSFEVTTKDATADSLSFVASPNAPYCFYFNKHNIGNQGTTIKLDLKSEYQDRVGEFVDYVISTFKHTAIPIFVADATSVAEVLSPGFQVSKQEIIEEFVEPPYRKQFSDFTLVQTNISQSEFEGTCGIFNPSSYEGENFVIRKKSTGCKIFQNGVFVCTFSNLVGEINIKQPLLLKANREGFENHDEIQSIISQFERAILEKITPVIIDNLQKMLFTRFYLYNYYGNGKIGKEDLLQAGNLHSIYVAMEGNIFPLSHSQLLGFQKIGIIHVDTGVFIEQKQMIKLSSELEMPFVCVAAMMDANYLRQYLKVVGFNFQIRNTNEISYLLAEKGIPAYQGSYTVKQSIILPFDDEKICSHLINLGNSEYLNSEHPILRSVEDRFDELRKNRSLAKTAETFFETLLDQLRNAYPPQQFTGRAFKLADLQYYLDELNDELGATHKLSLSDFPQWMHDKIST